MESIKLIFSSSFNLGIVCIYGLAKTVYINKSVQKAVSSLQNNYRIDADYLFKSS